MDFSGLFGSDGIVHAVSGVFDSDVSRQTLAFVIAAWLHRGWVKKDLSEQFTKLTESINHVATAMASRMDGIDRRMDSIEDKVLNKVDTPKG